MWHSHFTGVEELDAQLLLPRVLGWILENLELLLQVRHGLPDLVVDEHNMVRLVMAHPLALLPQVLLQCVHPPYRPHGRFAQLVIARFDHSVDLIGVEEALNLKPDGMQAI